MRSSDVEASLFSTSDDEVMRHPQPTSHRPALGVAFVALLLAAAVAIASFRSHDAPLGGMVTASSMYDAVTCSAPGTNCLESKCCIDGGASGFQCYKKGKEWGECMDADSCEPGVHKGEKHGVWDASGTFQLDKWSCDPVGKTSKPSCSSYSKLSSCPTDRCGWKNNTCRAVCSSLPDTDTCWNSGYCMWDGGCKDACWEMEKQECGEHSRCMWFKEEKGDHCTLACHVHASEDDCPHAEHCMWADGQCSDDPCSAQWEDCRETQCCSAARGAIGMQCTEKNKDYATCIERFDPKYQKNWTGKKLGNRTKFQAGCSWAGKDCSETHMCCNEGFNCMKKDDTFAGCAQSQQVSTWDEQDVPPPEGWDGKVLGGWRGEYAVDPAPEGTDMAGTSFYCIMAVLPDSPEMDLLDVARKNKASVFGCDDHSVYHSWQTDDAGWDTGRTTLVNTAVFLKVFHWVKRDGKYLDHDWTIKVDADCVFVPQRLRDHIYGLRPPKDTAVYMKNNDLEGLGNDGFLGAVEVFSKRAIQVYLDNDAECGKYLGTNSGEDGFFKGCMDALGIGFVWDRDMFTPNYDPAMCTKGQYAAFHPIKYASHWQRCWDLATTDKCAGLTYDCLGKLDPPVESLGQSRK